MDVEKELLEIADTRGINKRVRNRLLKLRQRVRFEKEAIRQIREEQLDRMAAAARANGPDGPDEPSWRRKSYGRRDGPLKRHRHQHRRHRRDTVLVCNTSESDASDSGGTIKTARMQPLRAKTMSPKEQPPVAAKARAASAPPATFAEAARATDSGDSDSDSVTSFASLDMASDVDEADAHAAAVRAAARTRNVREAIAPAPAPAAKPAARPPTPPYPPPQKQQPFRQPVYPPMENPPGPWRKTAARGGDRHPPPVTSGSASIDKRWWWKRFGELRRKLDTDGTIADDPSMLFWVQANRDTHFAPISQRTQLHNLLRHHNLHSLL